MLLSGACDAAEADLAEETGAEIIGQALEGLQEARRLVASVDRQVRHLSAMAGDTWHAASSWQLHS